uniref:Putative secreted protein n=1 Tax=Anopheles triannulatus TaxID=58253 RepID=A0A2M4B639_9DIPT
MTVCAAACCSLFFPRFYASPSADENVADTLTRVPNSKECAHWRRRCVLLLQGSRPATSFYDVCAHQTHTHTGNPFSIQYLVGHRQW